MWRFCLFISLLCVGCDSFIGISNDEIISTKIKCEKAGMDYEIIKSNAVHGIVINAICIKKK
jgi:hypothetical protein